MKTLDFRYISQSISEDLKEKMVFIGGPRQVGKTTLALQFLRTKSKEDRAYLNWDDATDRKKILLGELPVSNPIVVLDEIHKFARWRQLVKGIFDKHVPKTNVIVTGSARLDYYRKSGDSLIGRYHYYRLHPFTLPELIGAVSHSNMEHLLQYGGFPEPFTKASERFHRRWQLERMNRVLREDLADLERVQELSLLELLVEALPSRVGSPLSIQSLKEDLQVSHDAVSRWLAIIERLYLIFRISPFGSPKIRAVKKEQKLYLWDWSVISDPGARFENFVASHLLKYCHFLEDTQGHRMELRYLRDTDKREIDFVVLQDKNPLFAVECKLKDESRSTALKYFKERTKIPHFFQVHNGIKDYGRSDVEGRVIPFTKFCDEQGLV